MTDDPIDPSRRTFLKLAGTAPAAVVPTGSMAEVAVYMDDISSAISAAGSIAKIAARVGAAGNLDEAIEYFYTADSSHLDEFLNRRILPALQGWLGKKGEVIAFLAKERDRCTFGKADFPDDYHRQIYEEVEEGVRILREKLVERGHSAEHIISDLRSGVANARKQLREMIRNLSKEELDGFFLEKVRDGQGGIHLPSDVYDIFKEVRPDYEDAFSEASRRYRMEQLRGLTEATRFDEAGAHSRQKHESERFEITPARAPARFPKYNVRELQSLTPGKWMFALEFLDDEEKLTQERVLRILRPYFEDASLLQDPLRTAIAIGEDNSVTISTDSYIAREILRHISTNHRGKSAEEFYAMP